jgi:hypothetical protein
MGTITLQDLGGGNVQVTVNLVSDLFFVHTGLSETIDFNLNGSPTIAVGSFSSPNFLLAGTTAGSYHFDGFGDFQYTIAIKPSFGQGAGSKQPAPLSFIVTAPGLNLASFHKTTSTGAYFGVDVINTATGATGPIGAVDEPTTQTPEPASLLLVGTGLLALAGLRRRS